MVIEDELLPQQLKRQRHEEKRVRGVVSVEDIKSVSDEYITADRQTGGSEIEVFDYVAQEGLELQKHPPYSA
jgi:hypothetical protein